MATLLSGSYAQMMGGLVEAVAIGGSGVALAQEVYYDENLQDDI